MSSIATILPGTPGPSCDSQALGGAQSQTKQIYDEVYSAEMITDTIWQDGFPSSTYRPTQWTYEYDALNRISTIIFIENQAARACVVTLLYTLLLQLNKL